MCTAAYPLNHLQKQCKTTYWNVLDLDYIVWYMTGTEARLYRVFDLMYQNYGKGLPKAHLDKQQDPLILVLWQPLAHTDGIRHFG
jgi:hypothetical protein